MKYVQKPQLPVSRPETVKKVILDDQQLKVQKTANAISRLPQNNDNYTYIIKRPIPKERTAH